MPPASGCPVPAPELCRVYSTRIPRAVPPLFPEFLWRGTGPSVHLTFDDGPHPEWTPFVLDQLERHGQKATFFCVGDNIRRHPEVFDRIRREGHSYGNHTMRHESGWTTGTFAYLRSHLECDALTGSGLFRPPYGRLTKGQARAIGRRDRIVMWDVLTGDFDAKRTAEDCWASTVQALRPGSIAVMHDSEKAAERLEGLLPRLLAHLSDQGWRSEAIPMPALQGQRPDVPLEGTPDNSHMTVGPHS